VWTKPDISEDTIITCASDSFGVRIADVTFLPIGADSNSAVYRVTAEDSRLYLLKLRRGEFDEVAASIPTYLRARGILGVVAPLANTSGRLCTREYGFNWMLYPYFRGKNAFEVALSREQWITFGETLRAVHAEILPEDLRRRVTHESYSPQDRTALKKLDAQVEHRSFDDPLAARLAAFWTPKRGEIQAIVDRAEQLAQDMQNRAGDFVICHSDLHAGNVLLGADHTLAIVDWDRPILAPKERDLMFMGGGVGGIWTNASETEWFYAGYGPTKIDPVAIAYYRYERIVADFVAYGEKIFEAQGSPEDRAESLQRVVDQFLPDNVIEIAHRSYLDVSSTSL
jgi:spectinomycin phosphotransferase